jgi:hypothetical protein
MHSSFLKPNYLLLVFFLLVLHSQAQMDSLFRKRPLLNDTTMAVQDWKVASAARYELNTNGICRHRLLKNTGVVMGASVLAFGFLYALPEESTSWHKEEMTFSSMVDQWYQNVTSGPIWDDDHALYNYVFHPYCGGVYYMGARGAGYKILPSFLYSAAMSTIFWEYGIEAFAEVPSVQDLIVTPVAGSVVGEGFFALKKNIKSNNDKLFGKRWAGITTMWLIDPLNQMVDLLEGERCRSVLSASGMLFPAGRRSIYSFSVRIGLGATIAHFPGKIRRLETGNPQ